MKAKSVRVRLRPAPSLGTAPQPITVRLGTIRDLRVLTRHRLAMERELGRGRTEGLADFERAYRRWLAGRIRARRLIPFFAVDPFGRPYGSGSIWLRESRPHRGDRELLIPRVHGVYVEPSARRRGIATELVEEMLHWVRQHGYRRVSLRTTSRAEPMYVRFGFHHISEMQKELGD